MLDSSSWMSSGNPRRKKTNPGSLELSLSPPQGPTPNSAFPAWVDFPPFPAPFQLYLRDVLLGAALQLRLPGNVWKCQPDLGAPLNLQCSQGTRQRFPARAWAAENQRREMLSMLREETNRFLLLNLASNTKCKNKLPGNLLVLGFILKVCAASSLPAPLSQHHWDTGRNFRRCPNQRGKSY